MALLHNPLIASIAQEHPYTWAIDSGYPYYNFVFKRTFPTPIFDSREESAVMQLCRSDMRTLFPVRVPRQFNLYRYPPADTTYLTMYLCVDGPLNDENFDDDENICLWYDEPQYDSAAGEFIYRKGDEEPDSIVVVGLKRLFPHQFWHNRGIPVHNGAKTTVYITAEY